MAALSVVLGIVVGVVAGSGCVHRAGKEPPGSAVVYGCVEVKVLEDLDYLLPEQTRRSDIRVTLEAGGDGERGMPWIRVHTDRDGCFYRDGLAPGSYRIVNIQAFGGRRGSPGLRTPDLEFPLWESALRVGTTGVTAVPTARGTLDAAAFELADNEVRYLGHFVVEYRMEPFDPAAQCLTRPARIKGIEGEVYLSSVPVGTRLCVEAHPEEAASCLARHTR